MKAKIREGDGWSDLTIMNVSATGFMAKSSSGYSVGDRVHVQHRGAAITGEVVWATRTRFGVRSDSEIDLSALLARDGLKTEKSTVAVSGIRERLWHWRSRG